jgi:hypothetical protein
MKIADKKIVLLFLLFLSCGPYIMAQAVYYKGYVIMLNNDTLKGEVKINAKKQYDNYTKVAYRKREGNEIKTFGPKKIKGYMVDSALFLSRVVENEPVFVKRLSVGDSIGHVYELQVQFDQLNEMKVESDYYVEKTNMEFIKIKSKKAIKLVEEAKAHRKKIEVQELGLSAKELRP